MFRHQAYPVCFVKSDRKECVRERESVHTVILQVSHRLSTWKHNPSSCSLNNHTVKLQSRQLISAWLFTDCCSACVLLYTLLVAAWILLHHSDALLSLWIPRGCCVSHCFWVTTEDALESDMSGPSGWTESLRNPNWVPFQTTSGVIHHYIVAVLILSYLVKRCHDIWFCCPSPDIYEVLLRRY